MKSINWYTNPVPFPGQAKRKRLNPPTGWQGAYLHKNPPLTCTGKPSAKPSTHSLFDLQGIGCNTPRNRILHVCLSFN